MIHSGQQAAMRPLNKKASRDLREKSNKVRPRVGGRSRVLGCGSERAVSLELNSTEELGGPKCCWQLLPVW